MKERKHPADRRLVADARAVTECCTGLHARQAARRITQFLDSRLAPTGLSLAQFGLLAHIAAAKDDTIAGLVERTGLDQSTLSRNLRALERDGLIEIAVVERDLRRRAVWLTETGARRLEVAMPAWKQAQQALARVIDLDLARRLATAAALLPAA